MMSYPMSEYLAYKSSMESFPSVVPAQARQWDLYAYLSKNLSGSSMFGSGTVTYQLPFERLPDGRSKWRLSAVAAYSKYSDYALTDMRFALGRDIGSYEARLCYSPSGSGGYGAYGYASGSGGRKFWLELGLSGW